MITLTRVKQATADFIKVLRFGKNDVQTSLPILPHGIDSKPVKEDLAIHTMTMDDEFTAILGYILKSDKTKEGETRIYATDKDGNDVFDIILKNDGTCEIGGNADNLVRYMALNSALLNFLSSLNANLTTAFSGVGGTWVPVNLNISDSKIDELKTSS